MESNKELMDSMIKIGKEIAYNPFGNSNEIESTIETQDGIIYECKLIQVSFNECEPTLLLIINDNGEAKCISNESYNKYKFKYNMCYVMDMILGKECE